MDGCGHIWDNDERKNRSQCLNAAQRTERRNHPSSRLWQYGDGLRLVAMSRYVLDHHLEGEKTGTPDQIREFVRKQKAAGADLIKIFASESIRKGGGMDLLWRGAI